MTEHDFADGLRGDGPPSRIRFAAFWIFTALICVFTLWAVVAAVMRMVGV